MALDISFLYLIEVQHVWALLTIVFFILSSVYRLLWPVTAILIHVSFQTPLFVLSYGLLMSLLEFKRSQIIERWSWRNIHLNFFISLFLVTLTLPDFELAFLMAFLPWVYFIPILSWIDQDSGGRSFLIGLCIVSFVGLIFEELSQFEFSPYLYAITVMLFFLSGWHRDIPMKIKMLLILVAASLLTGLALKEHYSLAILLVTLVFFQTIETRLWGYAKCFIKVDAWYFVIMVPAALLLFREIAIVNTVTIMSYFLVYWVVQDGCRVCVLPLKCREMFWSSYVKISMMILALLPLLGYHFQHSEAFCFVFLFLSLECSKMYRVQPMRKDQLPEQPCQIEYLAKPV